MTDVLLQPFAGLRPAPGRAAEVAAPPYDVVSVEEARALADGRRWSFLHVSRPEIDLPQGADPYGDAVYAKGAENLAAMVDAGVLVYDEAPAFYVYRLTMDGRAQTGLVAAAPVAAYEQNLVRRHEFTRPDKEDDRVRQIDSVDAQTGPVLVVHKARPEIDAVLAHVTASAPDYDVTRPDGVRHEVWAVTARDEVARIAAAYAPLDLLYIADGHHRSAAAARVAHLREEANPSHRGDEPYTRFLVVAFPESQLRILDYNRVVRDLNGLSVEELVERLRESFEVSPAEGPARPPHRHSFGMYLDGRWYALALKSPPPADAPPLDRLDVKILSDLVLDPLLGIGDPRTDRRIDFVGGIRGLDALAARVDSGEWAVAFALYPTGIDDLMAVADAREVMPPKSTWFEPKLADGLVSYPLGR